MDIFKDIQCLDFDDPDFKEKFAFQMWSTQSSSDYRNDRDRPYNGQPWTDQGERGKTEVKGITMRDVADCLVRAMLLSAPLPKEYFERFTELWDYTNCKGKNGKAVATEELIKRQEEFIGIKVELDSWRYQDVYKINWQDIDPLAIVQNLTCEIEKIMGIFPNIPKQSNEPTETDGQ